MRKIKITIETSTNMPTRNWFKLTVFVDLGMALCKDDGGGLNDERGGIEMAIHVVHLASTLILHPSSFHLVSAKKLLNIRVFRVPQALVGAAKNNIAFSHHHHFGVD